MKTFKHIIFYVLILLMLLPALQQSLRLFGERPLDGDFVLAERPVLTRSSWNSMEYQQKFNSWLEQHIGFRNFFVRLQNQLDFSLYRKANAEGVVIGKKRLPV